MRRALPLGYLALNAMCALVALYAVHRVAALMTVDWTLRLAVVTFSPASSRLAAEL